MAKVIENQSLNEEIVNIVPSLPSGELTRRLLETEKQSQCMHLSNDVLISWSSDLTCFLDASATFVVL